MPIVYWALSWLPMFALQLHVAVPVFRSDELTRPTLRLLQRTVLLSALTKSTFPWRMSPASESKAGSPVSAVMSLTVALSVTVAVLDVADEVDANSAPV